MPMKTITGLSALSEGGSSGGLAVKLTTKDKKQRIQVWFDCLKAPGVPQVTTDSPGGAASCRGSVSRAGGGTFRRA